MNRLKELRIAKGYTQLQVQMRTGIDQSTYSKLELGKRALTVPLCKKLALAFDTSVDYLLGMTDEKQPYRRRR
ncbi:MAG: helix-turn-helix domain-containing protein [Oscillospiraceae bacterium]|nr:helix-turn-helix domain-containing protein [Oscillospiraceae bacterium]